LSLYFRTRVRLPPGPQNHFIISIMQTKTIEKNIKVKLIEWLSTITDSALRDDVKKSLLVSGGSVTSMFLNEPVNDYDIYFQDINVVKRIAQYYKVKAGEEGYDIEILDGREKESLVKELNSSSYLNGEAIDQNFAKAVSLRNLKSDQIKLFFVSEKGGIKVNEGKENPNYEPMYFSPNAISLSNNIQIVLRFHGTPEEIHKTFDFIHATNYFTFSTGLVLNLSAIESILTKQLKYQGSQYPVTSIIRAKKFVKRGFNITAGELLKIMYQVSLLDLNNPDVLEEQLIGVDVAYFSLLIDALRGKYASDPDFKLTTEYFNSLIDKIFNGSDDVD